MKKHSIISDMQHQFLFRVNVSKHSGYTKKADIVPPFFVLKKSYLYLSTFPNHDTISGDQDFLPFFVMTRGKLYRKRSISGTLG